jgi:hypothetical protein
MHANEVSAVVAVAEAGGEAARPLRAAIDSDPHRVRVVHIGHEVLGAFLLAELADHVEEVSCITLTEGGRRSGAEPMLLDYVVKAARFSRKHAVEVVAAPGTAEAVHLEAIGFARVTSSLPARYRLKLRGK